jgi:CoA:oxalate CoA-transferase
LAEIGADVIKVEPPGGDPMRAYPELFVALSANKRSIVADLKTPAGRTEVHALAAFADVIVEGFRPGVAERLGVGYDDVAAINAGVIYCSVSGLGQDGPLSQVPGHDLNYQAWAGALSPEGGPPVAGALPVADLAGGMAAALAICAALTGRARTGEGERIDVAMTDVLATWTGSASPRARGVAGPALGVPGYGAFSTADGNWLTLGVLTEDHFWEGLCDVLGLSAARGLGFIERMGRAVELQESIGGAIAARGRDELVRALLAADVPVAPALDRAGMLGLDHHRARSVVTSDPWCDPATGYPVRFVRHPAARTAAPPGLDQHRGERFGPRAATIAIEPIGTVSSGRDQPLDDEWGGVEATIVLAPSFDATSVQGLDEFSHIDVVYLFDRVDPATVHRGARRPRGNPDWPEVGIFAQRAKDRPNRIGVSTCELLAVEGTVLRVRGLDAIDGTPVLDIKPHFVEFAPGGEIRQPAWAHDLMARYF